MAARHRATKHLDMGMETVPSEPLEGDRDVATLGELSSLTGSDLVRKFAPHCVAEHVPR